MKKWKKIASAAFLTAAICNFGVSLVVSASTNGWAVTYRKYAQEHENWCWAACAQASGRHENDNSIVTQTQVASHGKNGTNIYTMGTIEQTLDAAEFASLDTATYAIGSTNYPFEFYIAQLVNDHVTIVGLMYTDDNGNILGTGGHMVTIGAARIVAGSSRFITYFDPYDGGYTRECAYGNFYNGTKVLANQSVPSAVNDILYPTGG